MRPRLKGLYTRPLPLLHPLTADWAFSGLVMAAAGGEEGGFFRESIVIGFVVVFFFFLSFSLLFVRCEQGWGVGLARAHGAPGTLYNTSRLFYEIKKIRI